MVVERPRALRSWWMESNSRERDAMQWKTRILVIVALGLAGCVTVNPPAPKKPDMSRRVPVNRTPPQETDTAGAVKSKKAQEHRSSVSEVQWQ